MAELVGGAFLSAFLQSLFTQLASDEVKNFFRGKKQVVKCLHELMITLNSVDVLLNDAEEKQIKDERVRLWLSDLRDVTFRADDLVSLIYSKALRRKVKGDSSEVLEKFTGLFSRFDRSVMIEAMEIRSRLKVLLDQKDNLGLKEGVQHKLPFERLPAPLVEESAVFGRMGDKEAIVDLLLSDDGSGNNISVIPVVGMGGIGKTTLVQLVYNDDKVKEHFELRAWVTVSDDFDIFKITKIIYEKVSSETTHIGELFELQQKLKEALSGRRFLFVHDDVWNENYHLWDSLKSSFESGAIGSKIVVTTRSETVASVMAVGPTHHLTNLLSEDCWKLFVKHAFGVNEDLDVHPDLSAIGKEIVNKCKGLPLAIKSLGGLLRSERNPQKWKDILKSDVWDELYNKEGSILPALWLSYRHLPAHLKRCFAYCSMFPKDYEFEKDKTVLLWMAEGLLQTKGAIRMEELGEQYFDDLLSRSLLQRSSQDGSNILMHDLVHDLAMFVAGEFCVSVDHNYDMSKLTNKTRHISYSVNQSDWPKFEDLCKAKCLRTFVGLPLTKNNFSNIVVVPYNVLCTKGNVLRVLSLFESTNTKLSKSIGSLIHLRYLDLSFSMIEELPNSVCTLYNLQTLLLSQCRNLSALPKEMEKLINLRHLDIEGVQLKEMAMQIKNMKSLQTLNHIIVGDGDGKKGSKINELKEIQPFGGRLKITRIENVVNAAEALEANLKGKKGLTKLTLRWSSGAANEASSWEREREILDSLEPHSNLEYLFIDGYRGAQFSDWVGRDSFSNIISVHLSNCKSCLSLPPLGQLPSLKQLDIDGFERVERIGEELFGNGPSFMCLEKLWVWNMPELREWSLGESRVFLGLSFLSLGGCPKLNMKVQGGCTVFPSLVKLVVRDCAGELDSLLVDNLKELYLHGNCEKLIQWNSNVHTLSSLKELNIWEWEGESFPPQGWLLPSSLTTLRIRDCRNLVALNGMAFQQLTSLKSLSMDECPKLGCLPEEGLPASLVRLYIDGCPLVKERCEKEKGEDWPKIAHMPIISII